MTVDIIRRQSLISFFSSIAITAIGFLSTIYIARMIGSEGYGGYALFLSYVGVINLIMDMGMSSAVVKKVSEGRYRDEYYSSYVAIKLGLLGVTILGLYCLQGLFWDLNECGLMPWLISAILITSFWGMLSAGMQATGKWGVSECSNLVNNIGRILLQVVFVYLGFAVVGMVGGFVAGYVVGIILLVKSIPLNLTKFSIEHVKGLLSFSIFAFASFAGVVILNYTDRIMLGYFFTNAEVGVYAIAYQITFLATFAGTAISSTIYPQISRLATDGKLIEIRGILAKAVPFAMILSVPMLVGGIVLQNDLILVVYGSDFKEGSTVLGYLLCFQIFNCMTVIFGMALSASGYVKQTATAVLSGGIINAIMNLVLIPQMGLVGAGISTVIAGLFILCVEAWYLKKNNIIAVNKEMVAHICLSALIMGIVIWGLYGAINVCSIPTLGVIVLSGGAVYFISLYCMDVEFAKEIKNMVSKIGM